MKSSNVRKKHGEQSAGPKTELGQQRCAAAKTIRGFETRTTRAERAEAEAMRRLRDLEDLGRLLGIMNGPRTQGRKPDLSDLSGVNSHLKLR
jgi:hypothetical protein